MAIDLVAELATATWLQRAAERATWGAASAFVPPEVADASRPYARVLPTRCTPACDAHFAPTGGMYFHVRLDDGLSVVGFLAEEILAELYESADGSRPPTSSGPVPDRIRYGRRRRPAVSTLPPEPEPSVASKAIAYVARQLALPLPFVWGTR